MLFVDYIFDLLHDGSIALDKDLKTSDIGVEEGDEFVVALYNGRIILAKKVKG